MTLMGPQPVIPAVGAGLGRPAHDLCVLPDCKLRATGLREGAEIYVFDAAMGGARVNSPLAPPSVRMEGPKASYGPSDPESLRPRRIQL